MRKHDIRSQGAAQAGLAAGEPDQGLAMVRCAHPRWCIRAFVAAAMLAWMAGSVGAQTDKTVAALRLVYGRECNSKLHYGAYAERALSEGQVVAALAFRTAAVGESVHAAHHAAHLEELGVVPAWTVESVVVRSTEENLCTAIQNEMNENKVVYRQIVDQMRGECEYDAMASLNYARTAEGTHAALFAEVLSELTEPSPSPGLRVAANAVRRDDRTIGVRFYVCTEDGSVFLHAIEGHRCPSCGCNKLKFRGMEIDHRLTVD